MTDKILSQDEVDALLKGVASGEIDTDEARDKIIGGVPIRNALFGAACRDWRWQMTALPDYSGAPCLPL